MRCPSIQVNPQLPTWLALPVSTTVNNIITSTCREVSSRSLKETVEALEAQSYFAGCKQLLFLMNASERAALGPLVGIASKKILIPRNLAVSLASALSIETYAGPVKIQHISILFRRWLIKGLTKFPRSAYKAIDDVQLVWKDQESKKWLDDTLKPFYIGENLFGEECRRLKQSYELPDRDPVYDVLGIQVAGKEYEMGVLMEMFERYFGVYSETYGVIVGAVVECVDACEAAVEH